ncbi:isoprenoid biosynthesis glyoxalase ElbB [Kushneria marisflavi]|uniref:Isoprenoid biosynthesis protein ElbB n=1 Tax=Kushneria marisflavi TaxID=157779 RepID=A0A240URY7_9GAMM|nr:isoprenoid biosynthesis glyoxalase ElbB [Kushneria marisflavi]ART63789.1 isoprenoid biosynthesis protein ElbB [Kushneria marisflavi]RKD85482.1 enhancing lycopene biosynthesis protein 2 [Kushneria marisflavi]
MKKRVAVVISGCGWLDGTDVQEMTMVLLRLDQLGLEWSCFAPDVVQHHVIDHTSGEPMDSVNRHAMVESCRMVHERIYPLDKLQAKEFGAVIIPGGHGAINQLSDFAVSGSSMQVLEQLVGQLYEFHESRKPIALVGMAALLVPRLFEQAIPVTLGQSAELSGTISAMGGLHKSAGVGEIVVDIEHRVLTTPGWLMGKRPSDVAQGIFKLVERVNTLMEQPR